MTKLWGFWFGGIVLWELVLRLNVYHDLTHVWMILLFSLGAAGVLALLTGLPGWAGRIVAWLLPPVVFLIFAVQLVYFDIFGSLLSLGFVSMGGEAITEFFPMVIAAIRRCLTSLLALLLPLVLFYILRWKKCFDRQVWRGRVTMAAGGLALLLMGGILAGAQHVTATVDHWADRFGVLAAEALDLKQLVLGSAFSFLPGSGDGRSYDSDSWNVMEELDFEVLAQAAEDDKNLKNLTAYFAGREATPKNKYTGYFEGYNLIVVCAEAFSPYLIDEELTPTLYRLSHEGIIFENFYNSFPNLTTNGEYSLCMGLMPDFSKMSFFLSAENYLPFTLGSSFARAGATSLAYHNNIGTFYNRYITHPNMGYDFRAIGFGLDMEKGKPSSDLEMMEVSVDDYINEEPFHAYYMSYSGHADYTRDKNEITDKNWDLVADMEGSESYRGYYASQLELEKAMAYLVQRLEEAGIAERTVIVLTGDHMPYGLPEADYEKLAGEEAVQEPFWQYRNSFICWNGGMDEPVVVDDYCSTVDILPTLLNLFGLEYDSRLLAGQDVFARGDHLAMIKDGSFLADGVVYDSTAGQAVWASGEPDEERLAALRAEVENRLTMSAAVLNTDYYRFAYTALGLEVTDPADRPKEPSFQDIGGKWYESYVEELVRRGALNGNGGGSFSGDSTAGRAEFIAILVRALGIGPENVELPYTDLRDGGWYTDAISGAWNAGLLPEGETLFRPADLVTIEEAVDILARAAEYLGMEDGEPWARATLEEAIQAQQYADPEQSPETITRGAVAMVVARLAQEGDRLQEGSLPEE